jgi:hypothetical protein
MIMDSQSAKSAEGGEKRGFARDYERRVTPCEAFLYIAMLRIGIRSLAHSTSFYTVSQGPVFGLVLHI